MTIQTGGALLALLLAASAAQAEPIGYEQALRAARQDQPRLQAGELRVEGLRGAADAADELPDPRLRAGIVNIPVSGPVAFQFDRQLPTQISVGLEQDIPNLAKRRARYGLADADIRMAEARLGLEERNIDVAAGKAWIALHYAQRRIGLAREVLTELRKLVPVATNAVASGSSRPAESLAIRRELLLIEDRITVIEAEREAARAMLARYVGIADPVTEGAAPSAAVDGAALRTAIESNPELLLADRLRERADASVRLARAEKRPDFGMSVSYGRRDPDFGDTVSVMGSVTLPIFASRRQDPRIASARAEESAALAEREDRWRALNAQFDADFARWRSEIRQWQRAREELLPLANDRASLETASFAAGRADLIDVIAARTALALLQLDILEREGAAVEAAATLRLTYGGDAG
ncbi:MAG: TolC family protein [Pacificimonas sp.]